MEKYFYMSTPGPVQKNWFKFSYINSEEYQSDKNFDETYLKKVDNTSNYKVKLFSENIVVLEE